MVVWLPDGFVPPDRVDLVTGHHLRPIRESDVDIDYPAVMGSQARLWTKYGAAWEWPPATMSFEHDRRDLARHEQEIAAREAFNYAVFDPGETALLGCVYIDPPEEESPDGTDAVSSWWVIDAHAGGALEAALDEFVPRWLIETWHFRSVHFFPDGGGTANSSGMASDHERCDACGFDGSLFTDPELLVALRGLETRWRDLLTDAGPDLRSRPAPDTWSAVEYAAHSRDVTRLHAFGVEQALTRTEPAFPPIDQPGAPTAEYADADPVAVVDELGLAARRLARLAETAGDAAWGRGLTVGDQRSDVRRLLEHALHDSQHHLDDVERGLVTLRPDPR